MPAKHLVPRICLFLLLLIGAALFGGQPQWAATFAIAALGAAAWLAHGMAKERPSRDPYDLRLLREVHEKAQMGEVDAEVADDAGIICPHCGTIYAAWIPVCPNCKHSSHSRSC